MEIRDIENLFDNDDDDYKPIFVKSSFKDNYKHYESKGDKDKKQYLEAISVKQYLYKIMPSWHDIINDHKTNRNNSNKWKIQVNMHASFNSFLNDYQKEEIILRNGSGFVFESVDLLSYHVQKQA